MRKLMLIDGMAMVYRAYYALNRTSRKTAQGLNTSAILGFTTTLYDLMRSLRPTHIGVAFDLPKPTFRHKEYEAYKANRDAMPEDIQVSLPYICRMIEAFNIPILTCEGYEADDVIGTAAAMAEHDGFDEVLMVTPDKDFAQLVTDRVHLYRFGRMGKPDRIYGVAEVCEAFSVQQPAQVADILGLWGDSSDNIPGIPGVGEKKAKQLVEQFGSVEGVVRQAGEIKNEKLRQLVTAHAESALLSKHLATIVRDAPIAFSAELVERREPDYWALRDLFLELEFRTFSKKFFTDLSITDPGKAAQVLASPRGSRPTGDGAVAPAEPLSPVNVQFVNDESKGFEVARPKDRKSKSQPADSSQTSLFGDAAMSLEEQLSLFDAPTNARPAELEVGDLAEAQHRLAGCDVAIFIKDVNVAIATGADTVYVTTVDKMDATALKNIVESPAVTVCYDLKNLKYMLQEWGVQLQTTLFDVQLAHYLVDAEARHTLDFICESQLGVVPVDEASAAAALWQLYPLLASKLRESEAESLFFDVELPLVEVLMSMEQEGVRIDTAALRQYSARLSAERATLEQEIYQMAGVEGFNIASSKQLGEVLYEKMKITDKPPRTATRQYSTSEEVLNKLADTHPIIGKILEYRSLSKLISTYLDSFPNLINPATGRLHTIYNQTVTATGRLSSSNPNLQNIPIRTARGREIRKAFVPRGSDYLIMAADYSQIELRIIASLAGDEHMIAAFANGDDIHAITAAKIYHVPLEEVSAEQRRNAKSVNFGIIYGISSFGLSEQLHIPRKEAATLIDDYFKQFPKIKEYIDKNVAFAHEHGYAQTLLGRRRYLYEINSRNAAARSFSERNAVNMPIQGTSADMIKIAMNRICAELSRLRLRSKMILQVHDELVFDLYRPEEPQVRHIVEQAMKEALPIGIPIEVGIGVGDNWLEAH